MASIAARVPLAPLPLHHFTHASSSIIPPSPTSLPLKRPASASRGESSRKVSRKEKNGSAGAGASASASAGGSGSGRRGRPEITPKIRLRLDRDELGTGKSPARRLFGGATDDKVARPAISGISGASALPTPSPSQSQPQSPFLAPSPPLSTPALPSSSSASSQPLTEADENGVVRSIHDPGFPVHPDDTASSITGTGVGIGTPKSRRTYSLVVPALVPPTSSSSLSSSSSEDLFFPPTPSSTYSRLADQENIPPTKSTLSTPSSPKKAYIFASGSSSSSRSTRSGSSAFEEEDTVLAETNINLTTPPVGWSGMSGRTRNGKSKLAQVTLRRGGSSDSIASTADGEEGEELTPGKRGADPNGKEKLAREADEV